MLIYISQRLLQAVPVLVGISVLTFLMLHLIPGDPVAVFAGDKPLTPERAAELRHQYGLDRQLVVQYWDLTSHALRGDLGVGLRSQRPVLDSILEVLPGTVQLTLAALTLAALLARGVHVELIVSDYGRRLLRDELGEAATLEGLRPFLVAKYGPAVEAGTMNLHSNRDRGATIASGSHGCSGMAIVPCSMKTMAAVAHGLSRSLV